MPGLLAEHGGASVHSSHAMAVSIERSVYDPDCQRCSAPSRRHVRTEMRRGYKAVLVIAGIESSPASGNPPR